MTADDVDRRERQREKERTHEFAVLSSDLHLDLDLALSSVNLCDNKWLNVLQLFN